MAFDTPRGEEDKNKYKIFLLQDMITVKPNFCVCIDVKWNSCAKYVAFFTSGYHIIIHLI